MADSATIIAASLDSSQLEQSINKLVSMVAEKTKAMADNFTSEIGRMEKAIKNLGNIKIDSGGTADGGSSRRAKLFSQEGEVIQRNNQIAKEYNTTLDQQAAAIRKASQVSVRTGDAGSIRNADTLQTMNIQLDLLRERLREARSQYSSFIALASNATTTGDKGLYQFATEGVHKYGDEVRTLIPQIRGLQNAIQQMGDVIAPQGHTIQNYVNSLQKVNPELAQLNEQFKKGQSELQNQSTSYSTATQSAQRYTEEIRKQAQAIRESAQWKEKGYAVVNGVSVYNLEKDTTPLKSRIALEEQLLQLHKSEQSSMLQQAAEEEKVAQATRLTGEELKKIYQDQKKVNEEINKRAGGIRSGGTTPFQSYDSLRQSIAAVLGIQEQQVKMADAEKDSYNKLASTLKQLKQAYDTLGKSDRNSDQGKTLVASMHEVERAMQKIKAQAARPVSLESVIGINGKGGLSEKTLDDIAYKMQRLSSLRSGLDVEKQQSEIRTVNTEYDRLKKKMDEVMQKNQQMIGSNNALGRSWNYMKNRLAFYFTVGASTSFIKNLIEVRSQYEMNERALGILINSAERGTQIFNELSQMALVSPYTLIELSNAAKQLTAYDIAAKDVVDTTRRLADMASAVGVPMERLTYALGQIKAYGYLNSRDARMFANAGIPLVRELSKYYSELEGKVVSVGDVYDRMKKKAIDYNSVMSVITKMTDEGGKFFDFQAKMANTLKVQLANLTLAWNNMLNDLGASQQGVLVDSIAALKTLFLHWQDIYSVITKVTYAFGLYKLAQAVSLMWTGRITTAMGMQELVGKKLQARLAGLTAANKSFVSASTMGWMALASVIVEVLYTWNKNVEEIERLNKTIADGANESAKALEDFVNSAEMSYARLSAQTGKLPKSEAEKTWEALREQIEISSASADQIIPKLLEIGDLNQRLTVAFGLAERIKDANSKLSDLEDELDISQDSILGGLLGEGLIEDIEDYNEHLAYSAEKAEYFTKKNHGFWENAAMGLKALYSEVRDSMGSSTDEAEKEITNFARNAAQTIKDELGEEGLKDKIQVNEAIARVVSGVEQMFPKLRGKGKMLFETMFNDVMAQEFNGAVDKQAYYYKLFLERLKKDHGSAFQSVTDDILKETHRWSSGQQDAINKTAEKVKKDLPLAAQDAIDQILNQLNNTDFKLRIVTEFATTTLDDVQKQFKDRFVNKPWIADQKEREKAETEAQQRYGNLMRKTTESNVEYEKRVSDERKKQLELSQKNAEIIAANKNKQDALSKAIVKDAQEQKKASDDWLKAAKEVEDVGGYDFSTKKENAAATKAQHAAESELQKALKDELQLIDRVRNQYKKLTDAGATDGEALVMVTNQFANSLAHVNNVLGKNGIPLFDISKFAGTDNPNALLDMLKLQLDSAKIAKNIKPEEIKELEVKYSEIVVDAKAYNLTKITKGLNNELDRLKDEYELAVSLDADPELGNMFADWMGIDVNDLPRTASEYAERASKILNSKLGELGAKTELPNVLDITDDDMRAFEENKIFTDKQLELVKKAVEAARGFQRKETEERIKDWDKLLEKYAEYETKISKIQNDAVKERVAFAQQFGRNEGEKSLALDLQTKILAATDPQEKQKLIEQLQNLVKSIAGNDKTKLNIVTAINNSQEQGIAKANFEEFQKSPEWIVATGDLANLTDMALGGLINSLEKYKKKAKNLDPKQVKQMNSALRNLYRQQRQGNPFLQIANAMDEAKMRAEELQPEMDALMSDIISLEKEIGDNDPTEEQARHLDDLKEKWKNLAEVGNVSAKQIVDGLSSSMEVIKSSTNAFTDLFAAFGDEETAKDITRIFNVLDKVGQGASVGAQIGGGYGAAIGGAIGAISGFFTEYADVISGNASITREINITNEELMKLVNSMKKLEYNAEDAYGAIVIGAEQAIKKNKELQLEELKRELELENSRKEKDKDQQKIEEISTKIIDLEREIEKSTANTVNELLDISSHADFFEDLVSSMINALKNGEDAMDVFEEKWGSMIDSMVSKAIVSEIIGNWSKSLESGAEKIVEKYTAMNSEDRAKYERILSIMDSRTASDLHFLDWTWIENSFLGIDKVIEILKSMKDLPEQIIGESNEDYLHRIWDAGSFERNQDLYDAYYKFIQAEVESMNADMEKASVDATGELIEYYSQAGEEFKASILPQLIDSISERYSVGGENQKELSALQQGIQGITEDTAGALEAYMNGVSQQVYYQSDILTQIRDILIGGDADIQLGVQGQMLLQLQQSFQVQMAIQSILEGWSSPNGLAVRVEMA